ncbi:MAG: hypothetical protein PHQ35_05915 [Phycisphaerae bacterium]|nr:hypothetical protein [Phycisphaerae bacterium]MDD5381285.1 hypothetical protein [Phycisphaerae bacterium]
MNKAKVGCPFLFAILTLFSLSFSTGCNAPKDQLKVFNTSFEASNYDNSALFAEKKIGQRKNPNGEDLLWALQLASVERIRQNYPKSTECFDKAEGMLKFYDEQFKGGDIIGSTAVNENVIPYRGEEYDGVMLNTYKALNFMAEGKQDLARVEFNRALDRQRRAKEKFVEEINKLNAEMEKNQQQSAQAKSTAESQTTHDLLAQKYPNLYNFQAYPDFVNPFATYMAGVYFNLVGDHTKAVDLLKESYGMVGNNPFIAEDLSVTEGVLGGGGRLENTVWVIFENGLGPVKEEFRIDLPVFIVTSHVKYVGIALPKLEFRNQAFPYLLVNADGKEYMTLPVADMDRVVQTEFSKDYPGILIRAIISATAKAVAQYAIEQQGSNAATAMSFAMAAYSFATTAADVRIWTALPKDFQVARLPKPKDGKLKITPPGSLPLDIDIPQCNNAIVYIKIITNRAVPVCNVMAF